MTLNAYSCVSSIQHSEKDTPSKMEQVFILLKQHSKRVNTVESRPLTLSTLGYLTYICEKPSLLRLGLSGEHHILNKLVLC